MKDYLKINIIINITFLVIAISYSSSSFAFESSLGMINTSNKILKDTEIDSILEEAEMVHKDWRRVPQGEEGELYISNIIESLGNTKDARAIKYLINDYLLFGTSTVYSLMNIGETSVAPLLETLHNENELMRSAAGLALDKFLENGIPKDLANRERVKKDLIEEIKQNRNRRIRGDIEKSSSQDIILSQVRGNIIKALRSFAINGDEESIRIIANHAEHDHAPSVREEARKVLDRLRAKGIPVDEPGPPDTPPGLVNAPANPPAR